MTENVIPFDRDRVTSRRMKADADVEKLIAYYGEDHLRSLMEGMGLADAFVAKNAPAAAPPMYQGILDQNDALKAIRPHFVKLAEGLQDSADRLDKIAADLNDLHKMHEGTSAGGSLAKFADCRASMAKGADVSREIVASIDRIVNAPLPLWMMARRA